MVALNAHFTVLSTFCSLATLSLGPGTVGAIAIPTSNYNTSPPSFQGLRRLPTSQPKARGGKQSKARFVDWFPIRSALRLADLKLGRKKRNHKNGVFVDVPGIIEVDIEANDNQRHFHNRRSPVIIAAKHGASYYVSPSHKPSKRDQGGVLGTVDITSDRKKIASLALDHVGNEYVLNASEKNSTGMYLVDTPAYVSRSTESSDVPVMLQIPMYNAAADAGALTAYCATYNVRNSTAGPMTVEPCTHIDGAPATQNVDSTQSHLSDDKKSQVFAYNGKTGVIRPFWYKGVDDGKTDSSSNKNMADTANVLDDRDAILPPVTRNVTLVFVPSAPRVVNAQDATDSSSSSAVVVTSTATLTTTVTITGTAAPSSISAQDASLTSNAAVSTIPTSSSMVNTNSAIPTSTSVAALDVQVVGPANSSSVNPVISSAMLTSSTSNLAAPTTSINAEAIAASIAAESSNAITSTSSAVASTTAEVSSVVTPTIAGAMNVKSSSVESSAPTMTPVSTAPYQWMFKSEQL